MFIAAVACLMISARRRPGREELTDTDAPAGADTPAATEQKASTA